MQPPIGFLRTIFSPSKRVPINHRARAAREAKLDTVPIEKVEYRGEVTVRPMIFSTGKKMNDIKSEMLFHRLLLSKKRPLTVDRFRQLPDMFHSFPEHRLVEFVVEECEFLVGVDDWEQAFVLFNHIHNFPLLSRDAIEHHFKYELLRLLEEWVPGSVSKRLEFLEILGGLAHQYSLQIRKTG